jgi:hypothetical protein
MRPRWRPGRDEKAADTCTDDERRERGTEDPTPAAKATRLLDQSLFASVWVANGRIDFAVEQRHDTASIIAISSSAR